MKQGDRDRIVARYNARLEQYGYDIRTLASGTQARHRTRFDVLRRLGIESGCTVLDVGCGFGDFYHYLTAEGVFIEYRGIDINPALIQVARDRHPGAQFDVLDFQCDALPPADFVVSSSAFNLRLDESDNYDLVADFMRKAYASASRGVAVDLQSSYVDFKVEDAFYYEPERVFALAKAVTKRVSLRHDYPLFEFCVYLYPDFAGWQHGSS